MTHAEALAQALENLAHTVRSGSRGIGRCLKSLEAADAALAVYRSTPPARQEVPSHQRVAAWAAKEGITFVSRSYGLYSTTTISAAALERLAGAA